MNRSTKLASAVVAAAILGATLVACGETPTPAGDTTTLTMQAAIPNAGWDPYKNDFGHAAPAEQAVYASLTKMGNDGTVSPGLAESWEFPDDLTFELTLRPDLKFADGTVLDATAVKANFDRVVEGDVVGAKSDQLSLVKSVEVVDDVTVRLKLTSPCPALPLYFSQVMGMMVSPAAFADQAELEAPPRPPGAGPYTLNVDDGTDTSYVFERDPNFYDPESFPFDRVVIKVISDPTAALNALKSGQIDLMQGNAASAESVKEAGLEVLSWEGDLFGLWLDDRAGEKVPALADPRVRQAINYAIDKEAIIKVNGDGVPASSLFVEGTPGYTGAANDQYSYDPDKARELLADAGYKSGVSFSILSLSHWDPVTQVLVANLQDVGIDATINNTAIPEYVAGFATEPVIYRPYAALDSYYDAKSVLLPNGGFNYFHTDDPTVTSLFADASVAESEDAASALWQKMNTYVTDQAWFAFAFRGSNFIFHSTKLDVEYPERIATAFLWNIKPAA